MSSSTKKQSLFFTSSDEEDPNHLKKNKNVFNDQDETPSTFDDEIALFKQNRKLQLEELGQKDVENKKQIEQLQAQAQATLLGIGQPQSKEGTDSVTQPGKNSKILFDDGDDEAERVAVQELNDKISKVKLVDQQLKDQTTALFADEESDKFISTVVNKQNLKPVGEKEEKQHPLPKQQNALLNSLFDDDDTDSAPLPVTNVTGGANSAANNSKTGFSSLFDDDDDENATAFNQADSLGDDFDFSAYLSNQ